MPAGPGIGVLPDPVRDPGELKIDPMARTQRPGLLNQKGEQKSKESHNRIPSGAEQLIQITQHRGGRSPDEVFLTVILPGHYPKPSPPKILGPSRNSTLMMIRRIHQVGQRHLKRLGHFKRINSEAETRPHQGNDGSDYVLGDRPVVWHLTQDFDVVWRQTDLFVGLTQGRMLRTQIRRIAAPAWKRDLTGVVIEVRSAPGE
jgi:hypothetical protein